MDQIVRYIDLNTAYMKGEKLEKGIRSFLNFLFIKNI